MDWKRKAERKKTRRYTPNPDLEHLPEIKTRCYPSGWKAAHGLHYDLRDPDVAKAYYEYKRLLGYGDAYIMSWQQRRDFEAWYKNGRPPVQNREVDFGLI